MKIHENILKCTSESVETLSAILLLVTIKLNKSTESTDPWVILILF